jgi:serine/threonine protein kinase
MLVEQAAPLEVALLGRIERRSMSDLPPSHPDAPQIGDDVGPYRIESELGIGGMGRVYRAVGPDGAPVAIKLVKADLAYDEIFRRRFEREARIAQQVKHPHVVPVLDTGEHQGIPYIAQRFVSGGSLEELLKERGTLDIETVVRVCTDVAAGLDALCEAGLVHRDIKPGNVLLDERGTAYITDFGLAKDSQGSVLTRPGQALGSLDYMAPEQIRGEEVSAPTDVYALGCVLYELLTGAPPFADRQGMRVLWAHLQDEPPNPCRQRTDLPPELGLTILRALEKDPSQRPQTAGEFAKLVRVAAGVTVSDAETGT